MSYESYTERLFEKAREVFGREVYKAWPQIAFEYEHALWRVWNPTYGPLTPQQLDYAVEIICHALDRIKGCDNLYAAYKAELRRLWNHDRVDAGFKARAEKGEPLREVVGSGFAGVPAA